MECDNREMYTKSSTYHTLSIIPYISYKSSFNIYKNLCILMQIKGILISAKCNLSHVKNNLFYNLNLPNWELIYNMIIPKER